MNVLIKDRKKEIELIRMALNMAEVGVNYETTELIITVIEQQKKLGGKFSLEDGCNIFSEWQNKWNNYYESNLKKK